VKWTRSHSLQVIQIIGGLLMIVGGLLGLLTPDQQGWFNLLFVAVGMGVIAVALRGLIRNRHLRK
jgi:hypothetical protein